MGSVIPITWVALAETLVAAGSILVPIDHHRVALVTVAIWVLVIMVLILITERAGGTRYRYMIVRKPYRILRECIRVGAAQRRSSVTLIPIIPTGLAGSLARTLLIHLRMHMDSWPGTSRKWGWGTILGRIHRGCP
jgi:hypothetical protein